MSKFDVVVYFLVLECMGVVLFDVLFVDDY